MAIGIFGGLALNTHIGISPGGDHYSAHHHAFVSPTKQIFVCGVETTGDSRALVGNEVFLMPPEIEMGDVWEQLQKLRQFQYVVFSDGSQVKHEIFRIFRFAAAENLSQSRSQLPAISVLKPKIQATGGTFR